ncbi:MAG TPA: TonB family protein [Vicinamibacterales bacterium]
MDHALVGNLLAYCAQVACIAAAGCALPALLRLDMPSVRFLYWRALVLLCLALPVIQPRRAMEAAAAASAATSSAITGVGVDAAAGGALLSNPAANWPQLLGLLLAAGFVARLLWMGAGLFYLRRLRSAGTPAEDNGASELQATLGTRAAIRYVPGLTQPVTFGVLRPVVLLPDGLRAHDREIQRAVLAHELVHVKRHDWAWIVGEEFVRAALWFHPAMWWLISRVQLAREEVVDELVVTITGKRRTYVEALLAFADTTPLAPAPAFARRRHLFHRMTLITREAVMSSKRVVMSCVVMSAIVAVGGWVAVGAFPMQQSGRGAIVSTQPGPLEKSAKPITPENPIPRRLTAVAPAYPAEALALQASGTIALRVTLDATGRVAEVRRMSGTVRTGNPPVTVSFTDTSVNGTSRVFLGEGKTEAKPEGSVFTSARPAFEAIDMLTRAAVAAVQQWTYDPPADAPISFTVTLRFAPGADTVSSQSAAPAGGVGGGVTGGVAGGVRGGVRSVDATGALRVGGDVKPPTKIRDVKPVYPPEAQAARIQGVVIVEARIEPDGTVGSVTVLRSVPMLDEAAVDAVRQWQFTPTLLNGTPVPLIMTMTVNFTLK